MTDAAAYAPVLERARREIDEGLLPSCQLAVARQGELILHETFGDAAPDQRYVIFSCTKALIAAVIWQLLRDGELRLDDTAAGYVEAFASNGKDGITIEQLLVHTGGFPTAPMPPADGADP
ncbi:MAG: beta-lactamase family protein, partial [Acidimicrobiales bacterium]|nr:beta-lactamase family protein [Acidimicrobiales bacterium]